ncbi:hypothetical protein GTY67_13485 [Streptomyces sp. SID8374]|uniref:hypothetical protein n=1 Tax=Streptomyces sp. SID8374 TaxID=2690354 RepID=UPI0013697571|nr:hypothetical protein [Streptomyces sp. SID8374]MYX14409.1 hypothetical protein [Streptomyces sp. SID8374]
MDQSPADQGLYASGRDLAAPGRSSHPVTDSVLVLVGGVSFTELVAVEGLDPWLAIGPAVTLVACLKLAVYAPAGVGLLRDKVLRFIRS